jgi:hypothetical protein
MHSTYPRVVKELDDDSIGQFFHWHAEETGLTGCSQMIHAFEPIFPVRKFEQWLIQLLNLILSFNSLLLVNYFSLQIEQLSGCAQV